PAPSISANVALRLLQIHVCIIYLIAGVSKLQGASWWTGTAVWGTLCNFEFAPLNYELYVLFLRKLSENRIVWELFMWTGSLFARFFEIGCVFLLWNSRPRWLSVPAAILLHGFIGMFMGLATFSFMMLVMNMAFLSPAACLAIVRSFTGAPATSSKPPDDGGGSPPAPAPSPPPEEGELAAAGTSHHVKDLRSSVATRAGKAEVPRAH